MVKYIGSKRLLVPAIVDISQRLPVASVCDLFAGTTRVGQGLRRAGLAVHSNDLATYSEVLGTAYIAADETVDRARIRELLGHLSALPGEHGYFTETFCVRSRFFQPQNGMRVDAIRNEIDRLTLGTVERALLITSLMEAADRVDSTCGLQMAERQAVVQTLVNPLTLREPAAIAGQPGTVDPDRRRCARPELTDLDCTYLDPPYNQHSYFSNYHVWETLVRWDAPAHYGVACKREDCRTSKSAYNRRRPRGTRSSLIADLPTPWLIVSFSDEGFTRASSSTIASPRAATWRRWPSTPSATSGRRSGSTPRAANGSVRCRTCATRSCCSSAAPTRRPVRDALVGLGGSELDEPVGIHA